MQPLRAGADRAKRTTVGSRCSGVARQHRLGNEARAKQALAGRAERARSKAVPCRKAKGLTGRGCVISLVAGLGDILIAGGPGQGRIRTDDCGWVDIGIHLGFQQTLD